jgi:polyhydroxyalkanoate synthesis regulator phasin
VEEMPEHQVNGICNLRFATLEEKVGNVSDIKETLIKQTMLMEMMMNDNKKRDEVNEKQSDALVKISENLTIINNDMKEIKGKVNSLEDKVEKNEEAGTIKTNDWWTKLFWFGIGIGGMLIMEFAKKFAGL